MRHVRQACFHIGHTPAAHDAAWIRAFGVIRFPKGGFIDPVGLIQHLVRKPESLEHLHRAAGDTVGLAEFQGAVLLLHDHGANIRKSGQLCGQRQSGGTAAHDQHISLRGQGEMRCTGFRRAARARCGSVELRRVAGSKSVEVKLHVWLSV